MSEPNLEIQGPKTREQVAMRKLSDPFSGSYPFFQETEVQDLGAILKEGIVAGDFAKRIRKTDYRKKFNSSWNDKYVSLWRKDRLPITLVGTSRIAVLANPRGVLPATSDLRQEGDQFSPKIGEYLVKNRVAPREFVGLYIRPEKSKTMYNYGLDEVVSMLYALDPSLSLPIFDETGLVWPVRINKEMLHNLKFKKAA